MYGIFLCVLVFLSASGPPFPQQQASPPAKTAAKAKTAKPKGAVRGAFGRRGGGTGFVLLEGKLFVEAIVIHKEVVESGIFLVDTGTSTGCVLETYFAEKMKVMGLGDLSLKFGEREIKHVKATVLDHPVLQALFKKHAPVFHNRPIAGIIGYPAFISRITVWDFRACTIRFLDALPAVLKDKAAKTWKNGAAPCRRVLSFKDEDRIPVLDVRLNGKVEARFLLCTGDAFSWIRKDVAEGGGLRKGKSPDSFSVGDVELCPLSFELHPVEKPPVPRKDVPSYVGGCLGLDFLSHFRVTLDGRNKRIVLEALKK